MTIRITSRRALRLTFLFISGALTLPAQTAPPTPKPSPDAPMDANLLIALIAPRPLLLQTGSTDSWSDPKGEFLAAVAAGKVYKLLGKEDLGTDIWPAATQPIFHDLGYYMHDGGHGMVPSDWAVYLEFLKETFHTEQ